MYYMKSLFGAEIRVAEIQQASKMSPLDHLYLCHVTHGCRDYGIIEIRVAVLSLSNTMAYITAVSITEL